MFQLATGLRIYNGNSSEYGFGDKDGDIAVTLRDSDGSLTGVSGSTVLRNYPVFTTDQCYRREDWNLAICPHKYGKVSVGDHHAVSSMHLSLNREGRLGTTDDFVTSCLHFSVLYCPLELSEPHLFLCLPCLLPPFTV